MRYYYRPGHPRADELGFVSSQDLEEIPMEPPKALSAPIMSGRFYENTRATDGSDIGSRSRHREYMRKHGLTTADDFGSQWKKDKEARDRASVGDFDHKDRRETLARATYERHKP